MDLFDLFETSGDLETQGTWINFGPCKACIARSGGKNSEFAKAVAEETERLGKPELEGMSGEEVETIFTTAFCKTVITGHEVKNDKGKFVSGVQIRDKEGNKKVVPFNAKNMETCLKQVPQYYVELQERASDYRTFRLKLVEEQEKN